MGVFPQEKRLLELLGEATALAGRVAGIAKEQAEMLASDDLESFNKLLDNGQEIINKINGLHQESEALMQSYASFVSSANGKKIAAIEIAAARFVELLEQCAQLNKKNLDDAREKTDGFIRQIGNMSMKRKSLGLYAQPSGENSARFDKKT